VTAALKKFAANWDLKIRITSPGFSKKAMGISPANYKNQHKRT